MMTGLSLHHHALFGATSRPLPRDTQSTLPILPISVSSRDRSVVPLCHRDHDRDDQHDQYDEHDEHCDDDGPSPPPPPPHHHHHLRRARHWSSSTSTSAPLPYQINDPLTPLVDPHPTAHPRAKTSVEPTNQHETRTRWLKMVSITLEILFGIWAVYSTVRYCVAFGTTSTTGTTISSLRTCTLVLGILSALSGALILLSFMVPLFPVSPSPLPSPGDNQAHHASAHHHHSSAHTRPCTLLHTLLHTTALLLLLIPALTNLALVLALHPDRTCGWDVDVLWGASGVGGACAAAGDGRVGASGGDGAGTVRYAVWLGASVGRVGMLVGLMVLFLVVRCVYDDVAKGDVERADGDGETTHFFKLGSLGCARAKQAGQKQQKQRTQQTQEKCPTSTGTGTDTDTDTPHLHPSTSSTLVLTHSNGSTAPLLTRTCTSSTCPSSSASVVPVICPDTPARRSRLAFLSSCAHVTNAAAAASNVDDEKMEEDGGCTCGSTASLASLPPVIPTTPLSPHPHSQPRQLRRTTRLSHVSSVSASACERGSGQRTKTQMQMSRRYTVLSGSSTSSLADEPLMGSGGSSESEESSGSGSRSGSGGYWDHARREGCRRREKETTADGPEIERVEPEQDTTPVPGPTESGRGGIAVYGYGYGAPGVTYPYLDVFNPQPASTREEEEPAEPSALSNVNLHTTTNTASLHDTDDDPPLSTTRSTRSDGEIEGEEYVPILGGLVRRLATIESLGSREATTTLSMLSVPGGWGGRQSHTISSTSSPFSSLRFAGHCTASWSSASFVSRGENVERELEMGSVSTRYLSAQSGSVVMSVNEHGEMTPGHSLGGITALRTGNNV